MSPQKVVRVGLGSHQEGIPESIAHVSLEAISKRQAESTTR